MNQDAKQLLEKFRTDPIDLKTLTTPSITQSRKFTPWEIVGCILSISMILYGGYNLLPLQQMVTTAQNKTTWETDKIKAPKQQAVNNQSAVKQEGEGAVQLVDVAPKPKETNPTKKKNPIQTVSVQPKHNTRSKVTTKKSTQTVKKTNTTSSKVVAKQTTPSSSTSTKTNTSTSNTKTNVTVKWRGSGEPMPEYKPNIPKKRVQP